MITSQRTFRATTFGEPPSPSDRFTKLAGLSLSRQRIVLKLLADERHTKNVLESTGNMNYDLTGPLGWTCPKVLGDVPASPKKHQWCGAHMQSTVNVAAQPAWQTAMGPERAYLKFTVRVESN